MSSSIAALNALNFFMADVRDGLGPFVGVFLQSRQWSPAEIGLVMTVGALAGTLATAPMGALVDRMRSKRALMALAALVTVLPSFAILFIPTFEITAAAQSIIGIAGAIISPAIAGLTLGLVRQAGFAHQMGRNEAYNHAGNLAAAVLCGVLGYAFGIGAVFLVMAAMAGLALIALWFIDPAEIDHRAARGLDDKGDAKASSFISLFRCVPLLVLAATMMLFHLGNAAMLPLLGQSLVARGAGDPSLFTGVTVVVAQLTMIPMALGAAWLAERRGYWIVFVLALAALPVRGVIAALVTGPIGLFPVQVLDGVGAGLLGVALPGLVARILVGTGRINAGLGAVMTLLGLGAALSPALGGAVAQAFGYQAAFLTLAGIALAALALWLMAHPLVAESCRGQPIDGPAVVPAT